MLSQFLSFHFSLHPFCAYTHYFSEIIRISALMAHILTLPRKHNRSYIVFIVGLNFSSHNDSRYSFTLTSRGPIFTIAVFLSPESLSIFNGDHSQKSCRLLSSFEKNGCADKPHIQT